MYEGLAREDGDVHEKSGSMKRKSCIHFRMWDFLRIFARKTCKKEKNHRIALETNGKEIPLFLRTGQA